MKILVIGDPHGYTNYKKSVLNKVDLILITGDLGKADLARKIAFENVNRRKEGLAELELTSKQVRDIHMEIHSSTLNLLKNLSKYAPVYSLQGNVGIPTLSDVKRDYKEYGVKLPCTKEQIDKIKDFHLVKNQLRVLRGLRIGFLEYFVDNCWIKEFQSKDKKDINRARRQTPKAKRILRNFNNLDILLCHQPAYGVLDKVNFPGAPKHWQNKHAGSKVILDYIKRKQPKYVFWGHIHEAKGKKKIGKTQAYNVGVAGDYVLLDVD